MAASPRSPTHRDPARAVPCGLWVTA